MGNPDIQVHIGPSELRAQLREDAIVGLCQTPKSLPPKWFYDGVGSDLFEQITMLPEYYQTRTEWGILQAAADEIADRSNPERLVELGSGSAKKTDCLLAALGNQARFSSYVAFDVCLEAVVASLDRLSGHHPGVQLAGIVGDFDHHLKTLAHPARQLVAFLGGTIGNMTPLAREDFFDRLRSTLSVGDHLLVGADLVKERHRLEAAYNDPSGVTAAFNLNLLAVLNTALDGDFDQRRFAHHARWVPESAWIEMSLRSLADQTISLKAIGRQIHFEAGESLQTEISAKFTPEDLIEELEESGFQFAQTWTDPSRDFALILAAAG